MTAERTPRQVAHDIRMEIRYNAQSRKATPTDLQRWQILCEQFSSLGGMVQAQMARRKQ